MTFFIMGCITILAVLIGTISVKYLGNDNIVEEIAEDVIKEETGLSIDLSPSDIHKEEKKEEQIKPK